MDAAEELLLDRGFAGTSIDSVIDQAGVTKGAFFHHFGSKQELADALIDRYVELDLSHLEGKMTRAEKLHKDPLHQMLLFIGLFIEEAESLIQPTPGCLMGSYVYEAGMFDQRTLQVIRDNMLTWRERLTDKFAEIEEVHQTAVTVDYSSLADLMYVIFEGAFIMSRSLKEPMVTAEQLTHYRNYLELVFAGNS